MHHQSFIDTSKFGEKIYSAVRIGTGIGIGQEWSEPNRNRIVHISGNRNRTGIDPDMGKVSVSESEPKILVSPTPVA